MIHFEFDYINIYQILGDITDTPMEICDIYPGLCKMKGGVWYYMYQWQLERHTLASGKGIRYD